MPAQKEDLTGGWGLGIEKNRGALHTCPISPEMENSHLLKGDKNFITFTMADHDCVQV